MFGKLNQKMQRGYQKVAKQGVLGQLYYINEHLADIAYDLDVLTKDKIKRENENK